MSNNTQQTVPGTCKTVGVIGGGISGITAAWLLSRRYAVTLIEKQPQLGGHAHTHRITDGPDAGTSIDMGFIVLNDRNYPTLHTLFNQWGVAVQDSEMSFGFEDKSSGFYYSSDVPWGLFARRRNIVSLDFWRMMRDIFRFNRIAARRLQTGMGNLTLGQFLQQYGFSKSYIDYHIVPISAAVWSTPSSNILDFPAESILRFYNHHGLLKQTHRPQWQTVCGGSITYVRAFESQFQGIIKKSSSVRTVRRTPDHIEVLLDSDVPLVFDRVVLATHADVSRQLLENPTPNEDNLLGKWAYTHNSICLHTNSRVMPPHRSAWASWSYLRSGDSDTTTKMSMSYYMNRLQRLNTRRNYFVTLNSSNPIPAQNQLESLDFDHPCYTFDALSTHPHIDTISGNDRIYYCGAYCGYGFHEDGAKSGLAVARKFGLDL